LATDYTNRSTALALAEDRVGKADEVALEAALDDSTGTNPTGSTVYRPYYAAAQYLMERRTVLLSGDGAQFRQPSDAEVALLRRQAALDAALELTVPDSMSATIALASVGSGSCLGHVTAEVVVGW
jgi:hypothetical protein